MNRLAHRKMILRLFKEGIAVDYSEMRKQFTIGEPIDQLCNCIDALNALKEEGLIHMHTMVYTDGCRKSKYYLTEKGLNEKL